ncbi:MAG: hypothetical protein ABI443_04870 [Chthoniobacterales bacterium]
MKKFFFSLSLLLLVVTLVSCASAKRKMAKMNADPKPSFLSTFVWQYKVTPDKSIKVGRRGQDISVEMLKSRIELTVPKDWKIVSCCDQPLDWVYVASAKDASLAFGVKIVRFPHNPPLDQRFKNYLDGIQHTYDPNMRMSLDQPFMVGRQKVPSSFYYSPNPPTMVGRQAQSGNSFYSVASKLRLVVMIPQGDITTVIEFLGNSATSLQQDHAKIQKILNSYSFRKL